MTEPSPTRAGDATPRVVRARRATSAAPDRATATGSPIAVPDLAGPRVRIGILWFLVALAAVTSGRWWTAWLLAAVAAAAGYQLVRVWSRAAEFYAAGLWALVAGACASACALAAGAGTGLAGAALVLAAVVAGAARALGGPAAGGAVAIGSSLPGIAVVAVVLAVREDLWAGLFLVVAVSLYDAGAFLLGAESDRAWDGPVAGAIGVLAATFTISAIGVEPLDRAGWWVAGLLVAPACAAGQWATTRCLPEPTSRALAMRRLDAYVVAGPVLLGCIWVLGS